MPTRPLVAALALCASLASAQTPKKVAVLYFDNNTPNRQYDVLQKGLADMIVTDLSAVEQLQVVEREKLQSLIDELKLQRSKYFDPKTAQKLGKVAGAELAVTGAFAAIEPQMRIDIRMIEVATGKVVLAEKVTGDAKNFFDLQQELVDLFVKGLDVKLRASARGKSGATELDALLKYSQGVDAADKGDLKTASATLAEVIKDSPEFKLAKDRYAELLKRLDAAGQKRQSLFNALEQKILDRGEARTKDGLSKLLDEKPPEGSDRDIYKWLQPRREALGLYFAARVFKANLYQLKIAQRGSPQGNAPEMVTVLGPAEQVEVMKLVQAHRAATEQLIADVKTMHAFDSRLVFKEVIFPQVPEEERKELEELNFTWGIYPYAESSAQLASDLGRMLITGGTAFGPAFFNLRPTPVQLDKSLVKVALGHLETAKALAATAKAEKKADVMAQVLDDVAESQLALGRKEEAAATWEQFLEGWPTHRQFKEIEKKAREVICATDDCKQYEAALAKCDAATLMMKSAFELKRITRVEGVAGMKRVAATLQKTCPEKDPTYPQLAYHMGQMSVMQQLAMQMMASGDCKLFNDTVAWIQAKGGAPMTMTFAMWSACK